MAAAMSFFCKVRRLFSSVCILFQTSAIIHGGERNYIMATVSLYVSIYNLFISLLQIFGIMSRDD